MVDAIGEQIVVSVLDYTSDPSRFCVAVGLCINRDRYPFIMQIPEVESQKPDYIKFDPEKVVFYSHHYLLLYFLYD